MAQVALSRAQPSCPHCPPSRSPRARPFTFTSAAGRELGDRAALVCSQGTQSSIAAPKAHLGGTQCMPLSAAKAKIQCKCLHLCTFVQKKYRVLAGPSESPPKWSMYVMVSAALMALTLVRASAMMAELEPVPLGLRQAVEYAEYTTFFRFVYELSLQRAYSWCYRVSWCGAGPKSERNHEPAFQHRSKAQFPPPVRYMRPSGSCLCAPADVASFRLNERRGPHFR